MFLLKAILVGAGTITGFCCGYYLSNKALADEQYSVATPEFHMASIIIMLCSFAGSLIGLLVHFLLSQLVHLIT